MSDETERSGIKWWPWLIVAAVVLFIWFQAQQPERHCEYVGDTYLCEP